MKSVYWASRLRPKSARILCISLASILLISALCLMNGFSNTAYAAEKIDTVAGKITMKLDTSIIPTKPGTQTTNGKSGVSTSGTDWQTTGGSTDKSKATGESGNASGSQKVSTETGNFKKVLASTGDFLPYALVALIVAGTAFAGVTFVARRSSDTKMVTVHHLASLSVGKKIATIICATLLISGTAFAVKQAIADEPTDDSANGSMFARIAGDIVVNEKGEIKSARISFDNRCRSKITIKKIYSNGDFADIINGQIQAGGTLAPDDMHFRSWKPNSGKINPLLLAKLRENSGTLTEEVKADLMRNAYSVKFMIGDEANTLHEEQTVYENETAVYPANKPTRLNHYFDEYYTEPGGKGQRADANYIYTHPVTTDVVYEAGWDYYEPFNWFMIRKNADPNHINVFEDEAVKSEEFIPIEKIREAAYWIKMGKNPRPDVFNDQNDEWHMFSHNIITPDRSNRWVEMRIIHIGDHDGDRTGITFQSIHGSLGTVYYDSTYKDENANKHATTYSRSSIRSMINDTQSGTTYDQLSRVVGTIPKKTLSGDYDSKKGTGVATTYDRYWLPSFTEMVSNANTKAPLFKNADIEGSTYNFWKTKDLIPRLGGKDAPLSPLQAKYLIPLTRNRVNAYANTDGGSARYCWLRSISPTDGGKALRITNTGQIEADGGGDLNVTNAYSICWAI